jgi:hypothetical protein
MAGSRAFFPTIVLGETASPALLQSGTGTPEGAVAGSVGDFYLRVDGAAGSTLYIKESGAGTTTGWGAVASGAGLGTSSSPQFAKIGINTPADADAVAKFAGQYYSPAVDDGNSGTAKTIDWNLGNEHELTLTGNVTLTFTHPVNGGRYVLVLKTGAGGFTVTWPAAVLWPGGSAPTITVTASKVDLITFMYLAGSGKYYGAFSQAF